MLQRRSCSTLLSAALLVTSCGFARAQHHEEHTAQHQPGRATVHHSFDDVEHWKAVFDKPERDEWQMPEKVVAALDLKPGQSVADLGAGTGYFVPHLATAVGEQGTVFAVEVEPNLVAYLRDRAEKESLPQVIPVLTSTGTPRLPHARVDLVLIVDTFHHLDYRSEYLRKLADALSPLGRLVVIDWMKKPLPEGPSPDHKITREQVVEEVTGAGFELVESPDFLPYQYFLIFRKAEAQTWLQDRGVRSEE
jgi:ubiquinone/menaquinone biosynthesis C-methylase UbiE